MTSCSEKEKEDNPPNSALTGIVNRYKYSNIYVHINPKAINQIIKYRSDKWIGENKKQSIVNMHYLEEKTVSGTQKQAHNLSV